MRKEDLKHWLEQSDWKTWVVMGLIAIALITFIKNRMIEHKIHEAHLAILEAIDHTDAKIQEARKAAEKADQSVDAAFHQSINQAKEVIGSGTEQLDDLRNKMKRTS